MTPEELRELIVNTMFEPATHAELEQLAEDVKDSPWFEDDFPVELIKGPNPSVLAIHPPSGSRFDAGADVSFTFQTNRPDLPHVAHILTTDDPAVEVTGPLDVDPATGTCTFTAPPTQADLVYVVRFTFGGRFTQIAYQFNTHPESILEALAKAFRAVFNVVAVFFRLILRPFRKARPRKPAGG
ncbi:MAG: hypothetical protein C0501_03540 [Isosphaera sp.]|nr:hypothetical protein [Isosphaera sp.]